MREDALLNEVEALASTRDLVSMVCGNSRGKNRHVRTRRNTPSTGRSRGQGDMIFTRAEALGKVSRRAHAYRRPPNATCPVNGDSEAVTGFHEANGQMTGVR